MLKDEWMNEKVVEKKKIIMINPLVEKLIHRLVNNKTNRKLEPLYQHI